MKNKLISSLSALTPTGVWDTKTGEHTPEWATPVVALLEYVTSETIFLYENDQDFIEGVCELPRRWKPAEHARMNNIKLINPPPVQVKAVSRVEKLVQEKLISEVSSYVESTNPHKQPPTFYPRFNLGAIDKQMGSLSLEGNTLSLLWKVWDRELLFEFNIPEYVTRRSIKKWSLPLVQISRKTGEPVFIFSYEENTLTRNKPKLSHSAGVDLGRVEPFTLAVLNQNNARVAHYTSSGRLASVARKRERLLKERAQTLTKADQYARLGYAPLRQETLKLNAKHLKHKIKRLGHHIAWLTAHEITTKLQSHHTNQLKLENLTWATGKKYGSRWNHGATSNAISHSLARTGITTVKINPKNTSQNCHKCGVTVTHNTRSRTVHCIECKVSFDRDYNAAMNIAKQPYPAAKRSRGGSQTLRSDTVGQSLLEQGLSLGVGLRKTT